MAEHATTTWRRYAPEGRDWDPPRQVSGGAHRAPTTLATLTKLLDRAVDLYWSRRPAPARRPVVEVTMP